jgi:hypothetical protein
MLNAREIYARILAGERIDPETIKSAVAELRQGRASAMQSEGKKRVSKSKAASEAALDTLRSLFKKD